MGRRRGGEAGGAGGTPLGSLRACLPACTKKWQKEKASGNGGERRPPSLWSEEEAGGRQA